MTSSDTNTGLPEGGVLGVFAHPDDETLGAGDLLATAARAGVPVTVVTATRGERGEVIPPDLAHLDGDGPALAAHREGELARALSALGVTAHRYLDALPGLTGRRPARFSDSGMAWVRTGVAGPAPDAGPDAFSAVPTDVAARLLAGLLRRVRPAALVTEEPGGGYGHPDHVHAHRVAMRAVELAARHADDVSGADGDDDPLNGLTPWEVPAVGWVVRSEPDLRAGLRWVADALATAPVHGPRGRELTAFPADGELPSLAVPAEDVDLTVDTTAVLPALEQAMLAHRSQVQGVHVQTDRTAAPSGAPPAHGWFAVSNDVVQPVLGTAYLRVAPGHGTAAALADALGLGATAGEGR